MPIAVSEEEFLIPSQSSDKKYKVTIIFLDGIVKVKTFRIGILIASTFMLLNSGLN